MRECLVKEIGKNSYAFQCAGLERTRKSCCKVSVQEKLGGQKGQKRWLEESWISPF